MLEAVLDLLTSGLYLFDKWSVRRYGCTPGGRGGPHERSQAVTAAPPANRPLSSIDIAHHWFIAASFLGPWATVQARSAAVYLVQALARDETEVGVGCRW